MPISIPRKLLIKIIAAEDAQGAYGRYFIERQKMGLIQNQELNLSSYMAQLVINYNRKSRKKAVKNLYLYWQYRRIMNLCRNLEVENGTYKIDVQSVSKKIEKANQEIQKLQAELAQMEISWEQINSSGQPVSGTVIMTISDISDSISEINDTLKSRTDEKAQFQDQLNKIHADAGRQTRLFYDKLMRLVLKCQRKIDRLYESILAYESQCDEYLNYYWHFFCKSLSKQQHLLIHEQPKTFSEICTLRGAQLTSKNELFQKERDELNQWLSRFPNFKTRL